MQSLTFVARHPDGRFQSYGQAFADSDGVTPLAIHSGHLLDDGTAQVIYEVAGDGETVREILADSPDTIASIVSEGPESVFAHIHFEPSPPVQRLLRLPRERHLAIDTPMSVTDHGGIRITAVGPGDVLRQVYESSDDAVSLTVEEVGAYQPPSERPFVNLSDRQQEVLRVAVEMGYYEEPRRVTQATLGAALDCTAATVGSHLRRIERALIPSMVPDADPTGRPEPG